VYSVPLFQSRFDLVTGQGLARLGLLPRGALRLSPYLSLRVVTDSRSVGGPQAVIFSENVMLPGAGVRIQPGGGPFGAYGEVGAAVPIVTDGGDRSVRTDMRAGAYLFDGWSLARARPDGSASRTDRVELYADVNYLRRFDDDVFASVQLRTSFEAARVGRAVLEAFARGSAVGDRNRYPWANVAEGGLGVALVPSPTRRVVLTAEQVGGRYLREPQVPGRRTYADFRVMAVIYLYSTIAR
jgi:hypothetical protein